MLAEWVSIFRRTAGGPGHPLRLGPIPWAGEADRGGVGGLSAEEGSPARVTSELGALCPGSRRPRGDLLPRPWGQASSWERPHTIRSKRRKGSHHPLCVPFTLILGPGLKCSRCCGSWVSCVRTSNPRGRSPPLPGAPGPPGLCVFQTPMRSARPCWGGEQPAMSSQKQVAS